MSSHIPNAFSLELAAIPRSPAEFTPGLVELTVPIIAKDESPVLALLPLIAMLFFAVVLLIIASKPIPEEFDSTFKAEEVALILVTVKEPAGPFPEANPAIADPIPLFSPTSAFAVLGLALTENLPAGPLPLFLIENSVVVFCAIAL